MHIVHFDENKMCIRDRYYEKLKDKGENVYIDSLTYEQFMMLGDAELSRRFSMQDVYKRQGF